MPVKYRLQKAENRKKETILLFPQDCYQNQDLEEQTKKCHGDIHQHLNGLKSYLRNPIVRHGPEVPHGTQLFIGG
jgi:hypothetical protein